MKTYVYGHDFGNSETCGVLLAPNLHVERRIPSVSAIGSWQKVVTAAKGMGKETGEILRANHYVLAYESDGRQIEKYVGQKVFDDGCPPLETRGDSSRYWTNNYSLEMLMASTGSIVPDDEYALYVVTGMPISIFNEDNNNPDRVQNALLGQYTFWLNGRIRTMHVLGVRCIMEGAGALIAYGSAESEMQGVIDIGGQTTDLFVANGQSPRPANCDSIPMGVASASDRLNEKFREAYGRSLPLEVRNELLYQHVHRQTYRVVRDGDNTTISAQNLYTLIEQTLREIGQEIATQVLRTWQGIIFDLARVLIVGGGAHYYAQDIRARMKHANRSDYKPEMANAYGYAMLAEKMAQRAIVKGQMRSA